MTSLWRAAKGLVKRYWPYICFLAPIVVGIISRLRIHHFFLIDFRASACAGLLRLQDKPLYPANWSCPGVEAAPFDYPPWIADGFAVLIKLLSFSGLQVAYVAVLAVAFLYLVYVTVFSPRLPGRSRDKASLLPLFTSNAITWGNVAEPLAALLALAAPRPGRFPWAVCVALALAAAFKPPFLLYLPALWFAAGPSVRMKALLTLGLVALGMGSIEIFLHTGGAEAAAWQKIVSGFVLGVPGNGIIYWAKLLHFDAIFISLAWALLAALLVPSAFVVAFAGLKPEHRAMFGLGLGALLQPRFMPYDALLLPCLITGLVGASEILSPVIHERMIRYAPWTGTVLALANLIQGSKLFFWLLPILWAALVWVGLQLLIRQRAVFTTNFKAMNFSWR